MKYLNLPYPHGYLVWKGTQKTIVSDELLNDNEYLITTDLDAFCTIKLGQPSIWSISEFDRQNELHCYKPPERRLRWEDAEQLYTYPVKIIKKFHKPLLLQDGQAIDYQPKGIERKMIIQAAEFPAKIVIERDTVCSGKKGFNISDAIKDNPELIKILEAYYETEVSDKSGDLSLPVYQLALVRCPRLVVERS